MLGMKRSKENRLLIRREMARFALTHVGKGAFIAMLYTDGELTDHLGFFELESSGVNLLECPLEV